MHDKTTSGTCMMCSDLCTYLTLPNILVSVIYTLITQMYIICVSMTFIVIYTICTNS